MPPPKSKMAHRRRSLPVPGIGRLPFLAIDAVRLAVHHVAGGVEGVDRHVEQQDMAHLLAEAAEMRRDEEVGMDAGRRADRAGIEEAPDAPDIGDIAAVLHDGMDATGARGRPRRWRAHSRGLSASGFSVSRWQPWAKAESATSRRAAGTTTSNTASGLVWSRIASRSVPMAAPVKLEFARPRLAPASASRSTRPTMASAVDLPARPRAMLCSSRRSRRGRHCTIPNAPPVRSLQTGVTASHGIPVNVFP